MRTRLALAAAAVLVGAFCGCNRPQAVADTKPSVQPAEASAPASIDLAQTRQMLSNELTVAQVKQRLGKPASQSEQPWRNLMYQLPNGKWLVFFFKGPYVTGARFDQTEIAGIPPTTHKLLVQYGRDADKVTWRLEMDGRSFAGLPELQKYIQTLPKKALVEYQASDDIWDKSQPMQTQQELDRLRQICKDADVILLFHPGG